MELLVCMSIAGSIPVVICLLLYLTQRSNYNYMLGRRLLLTGLFFYLIPVQLVKYLIPRDAFPQFMLITDETKLQLSGSLSFWNERKGEYIWMPQWFNIAVKLWFAGIVIFAVYEVVRYWRGAHSLKNFIFEKVDDPDENLTYYLIPDGICGPCTIGFFRQKIVVPESFPLVPDFVMVYKHERMHLKNHDNLVKLACLLVLCLHWMNPMAYLLLFLYIDTAEIVSDSAAVDGCTKEKRQDYARLLVTVASTTDIFPVVWKNNLSIHKNKDKDRNRKAMKILKRRINYMMKEKRKGLVQRGIMVAVSALTIVAGAGTVLAYEPITSSDVSVTDDVYNSGVDFISFDSLNDDIKPDFSQSDFVFITLDGVQIPVYGFSEHALCTHSMVNGYLKAHSSNSNGGCTVKVYNAQRCEKCGYLANAVYSHTITYAKCPH